MADRQIAARLVVCETTSKWAVALRRQWAGEEGCEICEICETRSFGDCWEAAGGGRASAVVLEASPANLSCLAREIRRYRGAMRRVPVIVVGSPRLAAAQGHFRQWGAVHAVFSTRALGPVMRMLQRHWMSTRQGPARRLAAWECLPWGGAADGRGPALDGPGREWLLES